MLVEMKSVANFHIDSKVLKQPNLETTILLWWQLWPRRRRERDGPISMKLQGYTLFHHHRIEVCCRISMKDLSTWTTYQWKNWDADLGGEKWEHLEATWQGDE